MKRSFHSACARWLCKGSAAAAALLLAAGLLSPAAVLAGSPTPYPPERPDQFERISVDEGLSESVVRDILQDHTGFLWIATEDGLNRYDGSQFVIFRNESNNHNSISHSNITALAEDREGNLWIGTLNAGLNRYNPATGKFTRYTYKGSQPDSLGSNRITALLVDHEGTLWVGTRGGGLNRYNSASGTFQRHQNDPKRADSLVSNNISALLEDNAGRLWVGTPVGLERKDSSANAFTHFQSKAGVAGSLGGNRVTDLAQDAQGRVWVALQGHGLDRFDPQTGLFEHFLPGDSNPDLRMANDTTSVWVDQAGVVWAGTFGSGLCRLDEIDRRFHCDTTNPYDDRSLSSDEVFQIYEDRSGILWIGTYGGGLSKLDPGYKLFEHIQANPANPNSLSDDMVFAIVQDEEANLWVGTNSGGLNRIDGSSGAVSTYRNNPDDPGSLSSDGVHAILPVGAGYLLVGTQRGLDLLDPLTGIASHFFFDPTDPASQVTAPIMGLARTPDGKLWATSASDGLYQVQIPGRQVIPYRNDPEDSDSLVGNALTAIVSDKQGYLWIGTINHGLVRFAPNTGRFTYYPSNPDNSRSLSNAYVLSIFEDSSGLLWIGTTAGLNRFDRRSGSFRPYHTADGLPNETIYAIREDSQGRLWISTNKGLARFDPNTEQFKSFDMRDGLQSNEFNMNAAFVGPTGRFYFGGINGITAFDPLSIRDNPYAPPVALTALTRHGVSLMNGLSADQANQLTLRWPDNNFDFEFSALNFTRPEKNQYAYRLDPFDKDWNYTGTRNSGRYTNLAGGNYTLRIKAANNDGLWNEEQTVLSVSVIPPYWQTWWFRGSAAALLVGLAFTVVRGRVRNVETRNRELERMVRERTAELERLFEQTKELAVVEERNRLARDLHDSAKQKAFAALAQLGAASGLVKSNPARAFTALQEAETLVYEVIEELTFLIQEMYPAALKEKGLAMALREYVFEWESRNNIRVNLHINNPERLPLNLEQAFYRITQEALANVARHSQARHVEVTLDYQPKQVIISIADNGAGFDTQHHPIGVGLNSMRERMATLNGKLTILSRPGNGTCVQAEAPRLD